MFIVIVLLLIGAWLIKVHNRLVELKEMVNNAMGQIAVQVESRWDSLSSLISATTKYSEFESKTLLEVTKNRAGITKNSEAEDVIKDNSVFEDTLKSINVVVENYPELKASNIYLSTMDAIKESEEKVRFSRMIYNDTVTKYNKSIKMFPNSLIAGFLNFTEKDYFQNTDTKKDMPAWD